MRVLVTGSRDWDDVNTINYALALAAAESGALDTSAVDFTVVHGAARGADEIAGDWAQWVGNFLDNVYEEPHPADWGRWGRAAGALRNQSMVEHPRPDLCLAFIRNNSRGATDCAWRAERAGIPVRYHRQNDDEGAPGDQADAESL